MSAHKGPRQLVERVERAVAEAGFTPNDFLTRQLSASLQDDAHEETAATAA